MTLQEFTAAFDTLADDEKIQLVEYLADRMDYADGIDCREAAIQYADDNIERWPLPDGSFDYDEAERDGLIDSLAYCFTWAPATIAKHKEVRDAQLERAFARRVK